MTTEEFGNMVILELKKHSGMTYTLPKKKKRVFKRWFLRNYKRHFRNNHQDAKLEFQKLSKAFNL